MASSVGGIVLGGGQSRRMGRPKAWLPFGGEKMLQRVVRRLREVVEPVVVVAAAGQELPELPAEVAVCRDQRPDQGPLEGLRIGLRELADRGCDRAFVTSCDAPLLQPAFVRRLIALSAGFQAVAPEDDQYLHPLATVYRTDLTPLIDQLLAADRRRPLFLLEQIRCRRVPVASLRDVDPELVSLLNANRPEDYQRVLRLAGL